MNIIEIPNHLPPHWVEAHRKAAQIPHSFTPNKEERKAAIHHYWQALLNAIQKDRN